MPTTISDDPEYWRERAEQARTMGEQTRNTHLKAVMLGIAQTHEKIAKWVEERADERSWSEES
jgi:phenylacetate-coenzyme A ligase PaaK-like adenylate-forming protein